VTRPPRTSRHPEPRRLALNILRRVEEGAFADLALDETLKQNPGLDPRDRGLVTELVYGILRCRNRLDWQLRPLCRQPLERLEPGVLRLLRLGAYQILQLDRIPDSAAVDTSVRLAKNTGLARASGLINAVLRNLVRQKEQLTWPGEDNPAAFLEQSCSLPGWLAERWLRQYGPGKACALGRALMEPAPLTVRCNTLAQTPEAFANLCASLGLDFEPCRFAPEGFRFADRRLFDLLPANSFQVQDEASMLIAHLLQVRPGETVVDACAAPGGKTTHLAALGSNRLDLFAFDLHASRVRLIRQGAERLGCRGIQAEQQDMTQAPAVPKPQSCDAVLVDAPCSGLGVLRRNPETRWRRIEEDIRRLAELQGRILANAATLVRPGGRLVYSVCTTTEEETCQEVETFLATHPDFSLDDLRPHFPAWEPLFDTAGRLATWPEHPELDGFFAARLRRAG